MPRGESTPSLKKAATATNGTEIAATLNASIRAFKQGIVAYEDSQEGLERFRKDSESYLTRQDRRFGRVDDRDRKSVV